MPGFRRRSVSPEHAPDREGLPLARETFLLLRGPDRACEGTAGSGGPHSWHLAARVSRERIAPGRSSVRLTSRHRTSERTGLTRRRSRKSPDPKGGTPPCPVAGPQTDSERRAWCASSEPGRISPGLPRPIAQLGCRQPPGRTGTDPGGPLACGRARTCLPPAVGRQARWPAVAGPPPAGCPAGWPRRTGRRGRRGRRDHGAAARWPGPGRGQTK